MSIRSEHLENTCKTYICEYHQRGDGSFQPGPSDGVAGEAPVLPREIKGFPLQLIGGFYLLKNTDLTGWCFARERH